MDRLRRRPEPAAIDISWVSCRGVRSTLPFHTPCLYASIFVTSSSAKNVRGHRRPHRVKTPTDRAGGENPEWDAPLRLYLPDASPPAPELEASEKKDRSGDDNSGSGGGDVLLVRFELKAEVAVLGNVLAASAAVPVPDLVADGRTRRVSYQLAGPDGRQPNGVISFSYAFHERNNDDDHSSDGEPVAPPCPTAPSAVALPPPTTAAAPRLYPAIEWPLTEHIPIYPPVTSSETITVAGMQYYPPPPPATPVEPVAVYSPSQETSACGVYPAAGEPASSLYPAVGLAAVSCYPPAPPPPYGVGCGYAAAPGWDDRCFYS
ncbi:actin cytoskeleton-regulatory complex protein pan-1-like [Phragmites australis]|uniref:actin cytoskeleton-regulatory complex protein pan-1-like n=1 Tax=Phragmites australis TaxID=29695 RepID=UPI002D787576|nr:actin cytoskeleton-regulatory complex protein pan-1-like [Phragmites australis]